MWEWPTTRGLAPPLPDVETINAELNDLGFLFSVLKFGQARQKRNVIGIDTEPLHHRYGSLMHWMDEFIQSEHQIFMTFQDMRVDALLSANSRTTVLSRPEHRTKDLDSFMDKLNPYYGRGRIVFDHSGERISVIPTHVSGIHYAGLLQHLRSQNINDQLITAAMPEALGIRPPANAPQDHMIRDFDRLVQALASRSQAAKNDFFRIYDRDIEPLHYDHLKSAVQSLESRIKTLQAADDRWSIVPNTPYHISYRNSDGLVNSLASSEIGSDRILYADILRFDEPARSSIENLLQNETVVRQVISGTEVGLIPSGNSNYYISKGDGLIRIVSAVQSLESSVMEHLHAALAAAPDLIDLHYIPPRIAVAHNLKPIMIVAQSRDIERRLRKIMNVRIPARSLDAEDHYVSHPGESSNFYRSFHVVYTFPLAEAGWGYGEGQYMTRLGLFDSADSVHSRARHSQYKERSTRQRAPEIFPTSRNIETAERQYYLDKMSALQATVASWSTVGDETVDIESGMQHAQEYSLLINHYANLLIADHLSAELKQDIIGELIPLAFSLPGEYISGASMIDLDARLATAGRMVDEIERDADLHVILDDYGFPLDLASTSDEYQEAVSYTLSRIATEYLREISADPPIAPEQRGLLQASVAWFASGRGTDADRYTNIKNEFGFVPLRRGLGRATDIFDVPLGPDNVTSRHIRDTYRHWSQQNFQPIADLTPSRFFSNKIIEASQEIMHRLNYDFRQR